MNCEPSALVTTICVPVSPQRGFAMSTRPCTDAASFQNSLPAPTGSSLSVSRALGASGRREGSLAISAAT
jgi:hypothetical protein